MRAEAGNIDEASALFVAQDRQADTCLHVNPFAGRKNMEHEVRNVRVRNRVVVSLLDLCLQDGFIVVRWIQK